MKISYKIGEIAKIFNISTDTLRFYEKEGLLRAKRDKNGYRTYSLFDIWKLNVIRTMKSLGISLKEIKNFLENRSVSNERDLLKRELAFIGEEIKRLDYQKSQVIRRLEILDEAEAETDFMKVTFKKIPQRKVIYTEYSFRDDEEVDLAFTKLATRSDRLYFFNRDFGMVLPLEKVEKKEFKSYTRGFLVLEDGPYDDIIEEGTYALLRYKGSYDKSEAAYEKLLEEIKDLNHAPYAIERYLIDINLSSDEDEYITEIQIKIDPA